VDRIASWEEVHDTTSGSRPASNVEDDPEAAAAALHQLVELGYLEAPGEDIQRDIVRARAEQKFNLACTYVDGRQPARALTLAEELAKQFPEQVRYVVLAGQAAVSAGDAAALRRALDALEVLKPDHEQIVLFRAFHYWFTDDLAGALRHFETAAVNAPEDSWLHCRIGRAYLRLRRWREAEEAFRKSLELDADNAEAYYGLSVALPRQGRIEEGVQCGLQAISLFHDFPVAHFQLGAILSRLGWYERALQAFEICLAMRPDFALAHRYVSLICNQLGRLEIANKHRTIASRIVGEGLPQPSVD
jgi:tetratricopeptide (TPR) repeat protein